MHYVLILSERSNFINSKFKDVITLKFVSCNDFFASLDKIKLDLITIFLIDFDMPGTGKAIDIINEFKLKKAKIISIK